MDIGIINTTKIYDPYENFRSHREQPIVNAGSLKVALTDAAMRTPGDIAAVGAGLSVASVSISSEGQARSKVASLGSRVGMTTKPSSIQNIEQAGEMIDKIKNNLNPTYVNLHKPGSSENQIMNSGSMKVAITGSAMKDSGDIAAVGAGLSVAKVSVGSEAQARSKIASLSSRVEMTTKPKSIKNIKEAKNTVDRLKNDIEPSYVKLHKLNYVGGQFIDAES